MSKHTRSLTAAKNSNNASIEHKEIFDDSLLPDASEIVKLHAIDPTILDWLKLRTEREQDFRHAAYNDRTAKIDKKNCREHNTVRWGMIVYSILVALAITASYLLLSNGKNVQGTLFGGTAIILAFAVLLVKKPQSKKEDENK